MNNLKFILWLLALALPLAEVNAQTYINREWVNSTSAVNNDINRTSSITNNGKLFVTGNVISGSQTDILTIAYNQAGDTVWVATQTGTLTDGDDYGIHITATQDGDIVVAAAAENTGTNYDFSIYHYDGMTGLLNWQYTWNGDGNGIDIPASIDSDNSGNIYVAGGSESVSGTSDFAIVKLSPSGTFLWQTYYDYSGLHDAATNIVVQNKIIVTGGSNESIGDWDIATLKLNPSTGAILATSRSDIPDATIAEALGMKTDDENNIYITGFAEISGNKNIQTIKLDSLLNPLWIADFEGSFDDVGNGIDIDGFGNVYVTGYSEIDVAKPRAITIKYSSAGDTLWTRFYGNTITENGAVARAINVQPDGSSFIVGSANEADNAAFLLFSYDANGKLIFSERHEVPTLQNNGFEVEVDSNQVYLTGFTSSLGSTNLTSIKYTLKQKDTSLYHNPTTTLPVYMERELIVSVHPSLVNTSEINNLGKEYWELGEIFDAALVTDIEQAFDGLCQGGRDCPVTVYRIFKNQQTLDTLSITRLGDTIKVPKFWSTFLFEFEHGVNITEAANGLSDLFPSINYTTYNLVGFLDDEPNDPEYELRQVSLHEGFPVLWDENHINIEPAWNYETGKRFVRVGILDTPVDWDHEDFGGADATKVSGWDFIQDESVYTADIIVAEDHGTAVAGIVGAIRNNEKGIAGIAGGNAEVSDEIDSTGTAIYGFNVTFRDEDGEHITVLSHIAETVYSTSVYEPESETNVGLHIMNNSWGVSNRPYYGDPINPWFLDTNITLLRESFHFANRNKITVVASRGNDGLMQDAGTYHYNYPGVLDEDWILCVGGTGTDGNYHNADHLFEYGYKTSQGWEIDVSAASCGSHNWSLRPDDTYSNFNGTSAAAPHASGVASLLMSYLNHSDYHYDNLAPEDIEYILENSALDVDITGVDSLTGHGRIDAGAAFDLIDKDRYALKHFGTDAFPYSPTFEVHTLNDTITFSERFSTDDDIWFLPGQNYIVNTYKVTAVSEHSLSEGQSIIDSWPRPSSSNLFALFGDDNVIEPRERIELNSVTETDAVMTGYIYEVKDTTGTLIGWAPFELDDPDNPFLLTYSLLIREPVAGINESDFSRHIEVYPNPTTANQTMVLELDQPIEATIRLVDVSGRVIFHIFQGAIEEGLTTFDIDLSKIPSGVYFYMVTVEDGEVYPYKIIKQ